MYRSNEGFTTSQLAPRGPRTAVGQRADGGIVFVDDDGRQPGYSVGMTNFELAQTLVRLGAVRGMALDGGGSSTIAFEGTVLNSPSDGRERADLDRAHAPVLRRLRAAAARGRRVAERRRCRRDAEALVQGRAAVDVTVTLTAPDGSIAWQEAGVRASPERYDVAFPPLPPPPPPPEAASAAADAAPPAEGRWTLTVTALDDQGLSSTTTRRFCGQLDARRRSASRRRASSCARPAARADIRWAQARAARVKVTIETPEGVLVRTVANAPLQPGEQTVTWDGRGANRKPVAGGPLRRARDGDERARRRSSLTQALTVRRVARVTRPTA